MPLLKHSLSHYFPKVVHHPHSILYRTSSLDVWPNELADKPDRFVDKVESCMAHTMKPELDGHPPVVDKGHIHTFLRITLAPTEDHPEETIFVERVLAQQGEATHSVIPVATDAAFPSADAATSSSSEMIWDTLYDHACIILEGAPSALVHADHLEADHTTHFKRCPDRHLSLYELATVLRFVSTQGLRAVSLDMDTACETYSRWFCRASMAALEEVMRGAFRQLVGPKKEAAVRVEIATQKSVDAWLKSTFKTCYPTREVADENLTRQMNVMNDEERAKKMQQIAKRKEEEQFHAEVDAIARLKLAEMKAARSNRSLA